MTRARRGLFPALATHAIFVTFRDYFDAFLANLPILFPTGIIYNHQMEGLRPKCCSSSLPLALERSPVASVPMQHMQIFHPCAYLFLVFSSK